MVTFKRAGRWGWHALIALSILCGVGYSQDRAYPLVLKYPPGAFLEKGGRFIDVTKPPFNAKGDGIADDTKALIAAYNYVAAKLRSGEEPWNGGIGQVIYLPKGTYLVTNTIIYEGPRIAYNDRDESVRGVSKVRFIGEDRRSTIIRLKDNCPGYEVGKNKQVLAYQKEYEGEKGNNIPSMNMLRNITVNTGSGNPGAVGVMFIGANVSGINNVTIKSEDGQGAIGLDFPVYSIQGMFKDITVEGFDVGINVAPLAETNPAMEYISIKGQKKVGILVGQGSPSIRKLLSINNVPAISVEGKGAQVVIVDSEIRGGVAGKSAIDLVIPTSHIFARNVEVGGYTGSVRQGYGDVVQGYISEWNSMKPYSLWAPKNERSLNMPTEDSPKYEIPSDPNNWADPETFTGDDAERVQKAMNSGKPAVFLPKRIYRFSRPVTIPVTVKYVDLMFCGLYGTLRVEGQSEVPVWIEHMNGAGQVESGSARPVAMSNVRNLAYHNRQSGNVKVYIEAAADLGSGSDFCNKGVSMFARSINNENHFGPNFIVDGGRLWSLGFKTEGNRESFLVNAGSVVEVLGGYRNETTGDGGFPMVSNNGGNVSMIAYTNMVSVYENGIWETRSGQLKKIMRAELPVRGGYVKDFYIPLYMGYSNPEFPYAAPISISIGRTLGHRIVMPLKNIFGQRSRNIQGRKLGSI